jgi:hypothetical protein
MGTTGLTQENMLKAFGSGLPDGFFSDQKSQFDHILEDLRKETFLAIWNIFTTIVWHLEKIYFSLLWFIVTRKIWQPCFGCMNVTSGSTYKVLYKNVNDWEEHLSPTK